MDKEIQVEHFINDLKYVVISLKKDKKHILSRFKDEVLHMNPLAMKERFTLEYETVLPLFELELHTKNILLEVEKSLHHYDWLCRLFTNDFGFQPIHSMIQLQAIHKRTVTLKPEPIPTELWFHKDSYDQVKDSFDEAQTRIEDSHRLQKRILKVWNPKVLDEDSYQRIQEFVQAASGNFKYLTTGFWKSRRWLYSYFIQDMELLTQKEIETLLRNLSIIRENKAWVESQKQQLSILLGKCLSYEHYDFELGRKQYEAIVSILNLLDEQKTDLYKAKFTNREGFSSFLEATQKLNELNIKQTVKSLCGLYPQVDTSYWYEADITDLLSQIQHTIMMLEQLKDDHKKMQELQLNHALPLSLSDMRKTLYTLERIHTKQCWLQENETNITTMFGSIDLSKEQDWVSLREQLQSKDYGFVPYKEAFITEFENVWHVFEQIIVQEQPIHKTQLLKRAAGCLGLKRVTQDLKQELNDFLSDSKQSNYELVDDYVEFVDKKNICFRISANKERRDINLIAHSEWKNGVLRVIGVHEEIVLEQISKIISEQLNMTRRNRYYQECIEKAVKELKKEGKIHRYSGGWRILT